MDFLDSFNASFLGKSGITQFNAKLKAGSLIFTRSPLSIAFVSA